MHAEFVIKSCFVSPGLGVLVSGDVMQGDIEENSQGKTPQGKMVTVVRIDMQGTKIKIAHAKDKINIILKGATISDVHPGMKIDFF
jgi:GTPase